MLPARLLQVGSPRGSFPLRPICNVAVCIAGHTLLGVSRRQSLLLYVFSLWTVWIWGTRIWNIWGDDDRTAAFKAVHTVLAAVSVLLAVAAWFVVRSIRRQRSAD